jgi:hypothetical protein
VTRDVHRDTVYNDKHFHAHMDRLASLPEPYGHGDPEWRDWPFQRVRAYAKSWVFGSLYGGDPSKNFRSED